MTTPSPIDAVTASAGTGKTHRLTDAYLDAVAAGLAPGAILATTFTRKAAAELLERIRGRLLADGQADAARDVLTARIGTVNALFGRIAAEFALEAGRSPVADVLGEERGAALFAAAADDAIRRHSAAIEPAAWRLRVEDWRGLVQDIGAHARQNGIAAGDLAASAERSLRGLLALLPEPRADAERLDRALAEAIGAAVAAIDAAGDTGVKKTADALSTLRNAAALAAGRPLPWVEWVRLTKLDPGAKWKAVAQAVAEAASAHPAHPRLHADLRALVDGVFRCAADAMDAYERFKRVHGLVDFVDQEHEALTLLDRPDVRRRLAERVELALVDEFQDTSPIQLALFLTLARVVRRSVWVGDAKQAIYGFRGTDPALIGAVIAWAPGASGGTAERLPRNYRSRPGLVAFHNDLFGAAFPPTGIPREDALVPACERTDGPDQPPPLEVWTLAGKSWDIALEALAQGVASLLALPDAHPVGERGRTDGRLRPIRGADIAILCRSNERCAAVAGALAAVGLDVAVGRQGLIATDEAGLALAALRYLVDSADTLAMVELAHGGTASAAQPAWLEEWLQPDAARRARETSPVLRALDAARARLLHLTPVEALEVAIVAGGVAEQAKRWGDAAGRLANLDALRGLARTYEDDCRARHGAATAGGLIGFLAGVAKGGDQPPSTDPGAVQVLTYHQSKGLEWPVVILLDLQGGPDPSPFGLSVDGPAEGVDPWRPLDGRWLRCWPWPYDAQRKGVHLDTAADASPEMATARVHAHAEAVRLMYVGMTRARDYLILAARPKQTGWLDALVDGGGAPILSLPSGDGPADLQVGDRPHRAVARILASPADGVDAGRDAAPDIAVFTMPTPPDTEPPVVHPPLRVAPSHWTGTGQAAPAAVIRRRMALGERLPLPGGVDMTRLGEAMHGFLAVDRPDIPADRRLAQARRLLDRWAVPTALAAALVEAGDRLWRVLAQRWPGATWRTEVPVHGRLGLQRVTGRIDLLLETADGVVIVDHKSFPGPHDQWTARALEHAPQLALYRHLVEAATERPVTGTVIHMPVVGTLLEVAEI
ncbi:UvrD-helicase domain-containing protein [Azospirillum sp. TSO35-2]|uniref:UvrD-helicase domain-containing protein n=1 Tax=Azospirillum sp. TSO35-2 TaxID=716796 RepID=UPI000D60EBFB|nr:UvrD-helicase domain-containing protein [Azospirillum sp. TSO35-2]PWC35929.1 DNA helicase UvrD [Azospirillum sp. TSO35-2]